MKLNDLQNRLSSAKFISTINAKTGDVADFSECYTYRYLLSRKTPCPLRWVRPALFIMLNPSTADAEKNDPTIRRCISIATAHGCTELYVLNLFALRATDPSELKKHHSPVGALNDEYINIWMDFIRNRNGVAVAAWGAHPMAKKRGREIADKFGPFMSLGTTKNGSPRHPLYVKKDQQLVEYIHTFKP